MTIATPTFICVVCGVEYQPRRVRTDSKANKYCSRKCNETVQSRRRNAKIKTEKCSVSECEGTARWSGGLCGMHYRRHRLTGDLGPAGATRGSVTACAVNGCLRKYYSKGYCSMHYARVRLNGQPGPTEAVKRPNGTAEGPYRYVTKGYVYWRWPGGRRAAEHRMVMAEQLGRELYPDENAHHRNGDRSDNRPENLELWSTWQPAGQRVEEKVAWARELLARYEPEGY